MPLMISILVFLSVAIFVLALLPDATRQAVRKRIFSEVEVPDAKRPSPLTPLANALNLIHRYLPLRAYARRTTALLEAAGRPMPPMNFLVLQECGAVAGVALYLVLMGTEELKPGWLIGCILAGFMIPNVWVRNQIQSRRLMIQRDLPEVVDLLALAVGAGSDFMSALGRIVQEFQPCPIREELAIVIQEVGVGKRRRDALQAFANRTKTTETSTFARTIIQADRMGTGMAETMGILSEDMRMQRYNWAERFAQQAPLKMLLPLIFSLSAAMIIVAGPIFTKFFRGGLMNPQQMAAEQRR